MQKRRMSLLGDWLSSVELGRTMATRVTVVIMPQNSNPNDGEASARGRERE